MKLRKLTVWIPVVDAVKAAEVMDAVVLLFLEGFPTLGGKGMSTEAMPKYGFKQFMPDARGVLLGTLKDEPRHQFRKRVETALQGWSTQLKRQVKKQAKVVFGNRSLKLVPQAATRWVRLSHRKRKGDAEMFIVLIDCTNNPSETLVLPLMEFLDSCGFKAGKGAQQVKVSGYDVLVSAEMMEFDDALVV